MRANEFIREAGTMGTVGSTTAAPASVGTVSQTPPPGGQQQQTQTDPNVQKLAATLKSSNLVKNEKEINDFMGAWQAQQSGKALNPQQKDLLVKLGPALMKNKTLDTALDAQLKAMSQTKPGQTPPAGTAPAPVQQQKAPGGL